MLSTSSVRLVILFGVDAESIAKHVSAVNTIVLAGMEEAVELAANEATIGETVMLSPACASLDMFSGYEDRGNQFIRAAKMNNPGEST